MGATFDPELIRKVASKILANEAKLRSASVILGPTVNIQRVCIDINLKDLGMLTIGSLL
jgi:beta-glucosidase-like glycosyl hydrolase